MLFLLLIRLSKKNKKELCIFKVDFETFFNSVEWDYHDSLLACINIPNRWRKWVIAYICSTYVLFHQCQPSEFFTGEWLTLMTPFVSFSLFNCC